MKHKVDWAVELRGELEVDDEDEEGTPINAFNTAFSIVDTAVSVVELVMYRKAISIYFPHNIKNDPSHKE